MGSKNTKLQNASLYGQVHEIGKLIRSGIHVDTEFPTIDCATSARYSKKYVICRGIHIAARHGNEQALRTYLDLGAQVDGRNGVGDSPLMLAARYNHLRCVYLLLIADADISMRNFEGKSAMDLAVDHDCCEVEKALRGERTEIEPDTEYLHLQSIGVFSISSDHIRSFFTSGFV